MKNSRSLFLISALLLTLGLYWPCLQGLPIWDDLAFWFMDASMVPGSSYATIWANYNWPLSVSLQKLTFGMWGEHYTYYHVLNLSLHMVNSLLLFHLCQKMRCPYSKWIFFFFLIHPANVISVAWMIQLKTLLCFFFAILSFIFLEKGFLERKWLIPSWILFGFSLLSKSSSVTLPLVFLIYGYNRLQRRHLLWLVPFFLMGSFASYRLLQSEVTQASIEVTPTPKAVTEASPTPAPTQVPEVSVEVTRKETPLLVKTLRYYFWESYLPFENAPIKGNYQKSQEGLGLFHIVFLISLFILSARFHFFRPLLAGHILLLPFLGIVPAPFMNVTWVSDQHLYLVLPFFLALIMLGLKKLPKKINLTLIVVMALFFAFKTHEASGLYKNEEVFYRSSLALDPDNVPIVYNLAESLGSAGKIEEALQVTGPFLKKNQGRPEIEGDPHFGLVLEVHGELMKMKEEKKD